MQSRAAGKLRPTARPSTDSTGGADLLRGVDGRPVPFGAPFSALPAPSADLAFAALTALPALPALSAFSALPALFADLAFAASSALLPPASRRSGPPRRHRPR